MKEKLLSICIPTYNRYPFVSRLVKHILNFNETLFQDVDIIIADNCSNDKTESFFQSLNHRYINHLKYFRNNKNIGATKNLEKLINLSISNYIWWFGDDDWMEEDNVFKVLNVLKNKRFSLILLDRCVVFENKKKVYSLLSYYTEFSMELNTNQLLSNIGPLTALGCISNIIFNKHKLTQIETFDFFCNFKTSHPQVGYLLANLSGQNCYLDINNKITTYAFRQTPEEYEYNYQKDKKLHQDLLFSLAVGLPRMYTFLVEKKYVNKEDLSKGKEMVWGYHSLLTTGTHADFILSITTIKNSLSCHDKSEMKEKIYLIYLKKFCFFYWLDIVSIFYIYLNKFIVKIDVLPIKNNNESYHYIFFRINNYLNFFNKILNFYFFKLFVIYDYFAR